MNVAGTSADLTHSDIDIISSLLEIPFSRRSENEKSEIIKKGRPISALSILQKDKSKTRAFHTSWYDQYKWLCGSPIKEKLFCWPCLLFSTKKTVWSTVGFDDLKNLSRGMARHACSKDHLSCFISLKELRKQALNTYEVLNEHRKLLNIEHNHEVKKNRDIMKILIDITSLLCKQELDFRDRSGNEDSLNTRDFKAIFRLILNRNEDLKQHWMKMSCFRGLSKIILNGLIECISEEINDFIDTRVNTVPFFACLVNEEIDVSEKRLCSIVVRLVDCNGDIQEHFLGFRDVSENKSAAAIFTVLNGVFEKYSAKNKLVAQTYDGGCVLAEELNDLQAKVREIAPQALFTHCFSHHLNLILQQSCSNITPVRIFFSTLQGIPAFFHQSSKRAAILERIVGTHIPTNSETHWNSNTKIISSIHTNRLELIDVMNEIIDSPASSAQSIREAEGFKNSLLSFHFVFLLSVFQNIFLNTDLLFNILQKQNKGAQFFNKSVSECITFIRSMRNKERFAEFISAAEISTNSQLTSTLDQNELNEFSSNESASKYKELYYEILDNIITQLEVRFSNCAKLEFMELGDTVKFPTYSKIFPVAAFNSLMDTYAGFFTRDQLRVELETVFSAQHVKTFHGMNLENLIKRIIEIDIHQIIPEAFRMFCLIATICASNVSVGKSSSFLKRIKTYFRNNMAEDRLAALACVSIEKGVLTTLENRDTWHDAIIERFAKKDHQINLLYM